MKLSPFLRSTVYDEKTKDLTIGFSTSSHTYHNVPAAVGKFMVSLNDPYDKIDYFDRKVEGKYKSTRGK